MSPSTRLFRTAHAGRRPVSPRQGTGSRAAVRGLAVDSVGGVPIAVTDFHGAVEWLHDWTVEARGGIDVRLVNAYSVVSMHHDPTYLELGRSSGVSLPDGFPVMLALRVLRGRRYAGRVRGPSFFQASLGRAAGSGVGEFFLGTTDETLQRLTVAAEGRWPEIRVAGAFAPPFQRTVDDAMVERCRDRIVQSGAERVWVALGTPKQDYLAQRLAEVLPIPCVAVGAAFDFLAGTKREAPRLLQRLGVEWVFRFASEPRRLWRRYLVGNIAFVALVLRQH